MRSQRNFRVQFGGLVLAVCLVGSIGLLAGCSSLSVKRSSMSREVTECRNWRVKYINDLRLVGRYMAGGSVDARQDSVVVAHAAHTFIDSVANCLVDRHHINLVHDSVADGILLFVVSGSIVHPGLERDEASAIRTPPGTPIEYHSRPELDGFTAKETVAPMRWHFNDYINAVDVYMYDGSGKRQLGQVMVRLNIAKTISPAKMADALAKVLTEGNK